jgi:hypothetical protein
LSFITSIIFNEIVSAGNGNGNGNGNGDGIADRYISVQRYIGSTSSISGEVGLGKNDVDTAKTLDDMGTMTEGTILSVYNPDGKDYQNTTSFNASAVLTLLGCRG